MNINEIEYPVIKPGSEWCEEEKMAFLSVWHQWEKEAGKDLQKRTISMERLWGTEIPARMAIKYGKVRYTKDANGSPYRAQLGSIKAQASDYKWLREPSARPEEEKTDKEGPSGNITVYIYVYV
jgi:hypothetical protein